MRNKKFHSEQSGAILLVLMASFLILFMISLVLFDTGRAAEDKMKAQIAADVSSLSHSVIKSRTMNMMTYANTIKRMFYSYAVTYANGLSSLIAVTAYHGWQCKNWNFGSCWAIVENVLLIASEAVEAVFDLQELGFFTKGRAVVEVESL